MRGPTFLTLLISLSALGASTARVELPPEIADNNEHVEMSGFGGRNKGNFELAEFHGTFTRGESRFSIGDSNYVSNKGKSSFELLDADAAEIASASCHFSKNTVNVSVVTFDPKKLTYQCEFRRGGEMLNAQFVIGHPKPEGLKAKLLAMERRRGESIVFGTRLTIESLHRYLGSKLQSSAAVGYLLMHDSTAVAVIELTDVNPALYIAKDLDADLRRSAVITAMALAVLRDPANSALED